MLHVEAVMEVLVWPVRVRVLEMVHLVASLVLTDNLKLVIVLWVEVEEVVFYSS